MFHSTFTNFFYFIKMSFLKLFVVILESNNYNFSPKWKENTRVSQYCINY